MNNFKAMQGTNFTLATLTSLQESQESMEASISRLSTSVNSQITKFEFAKPSTRSGQISLSGPLPELYLGYQEMYTVNKQVVLVTTGDLVLPLAIATIPL